MKTKIESIVHWTENREDFFDVFYKSGRSCNYRLPDMPSTVEAYLTKADVVKEIDNYGYTGCHAVVLKAN